MRFRNIKKSLIFIKRIRYSQSGKEQKGARPFFKKSITSSLVILLLEAIFNENFSSIIQNNFNKNFKNKNISINRIFVKFTI
ncbi:hypothetical protein CpB0361 [Chlamydia pneumoniae TW-183]|uniref:Uncharacterized protein n=2 Tax=Chlamydia pneumoniae TaxID=83558 RepID=Q9Z8J0_CHLPN|nr:hypothetical protein CPn_0353 [Chlamydia pneumoniae CWL029]AAF38251.1 hypothetical protein CP_0406 [Chlamydia pneumoniae AR39]AAP98292.1 hypothetical protein CpB0361 [Chlamydia pneumoniae TW-183]CRI32852.1 hypothetical protein BN1224_Wien1_A_03590 [Chlamydia pneumoniae]BAA98561.1 hypothetical protein [Chlamydia pneumoniae J138]